MMRRILAGLIEGYRVVGSPLAAALGAQCRFHPSCSEYASEALRELPAGRALALIAGRLARCHPWCEGGSDPVPRTNIK